MPRSSRGRHADPATRRPADSVDWSDLAAVGLPPRPAGDGDALAVRPGPSGPLVRLGVDVDGSPLRDTRPGADDATHRPPARDPR